jgi:hypothetical protein
MITAKIKATGSAMQTYRETLKSTVRHLGELYTIVVGLSLSAAIGDFFAYVTQQSSSVEVKLGALAVLVGFVATLIPFYHGTLRHLDRYHLGATPDPVHRGALLGDFIFTFVQGCLFFALAKHISRPWHFAEILWILLAVNGLWVITRLVLFPTRKSFREELRHMLCQCPIEQRVPYLWLCNNLVFIVLLAVGLWGSRPGTGTPDSIVAGFVALVCLARTAGDYAAAWTFYFPEQPRCADPRFEPVHDTTLRLHQRRVAKTRSGHAQPRQTTSGIAAPRAATLASPEARHA